MLHTWESREAVAARFDLEPAALRERLERVREQLYAARARRTPPLLDDKILAEWNGLMISAFARAALDLGDDEYLATIIVPPAGTSYDYAFRFSGDDGLSWTYCDRINRSQGLRPW